MFSPQIGNRFALTAAHCLYEDDNTELLHASSFSIMLGLHNRRKTAEPNRWLGCVSPLDHDLHYSILYQETDQDQQDFCSWQLHPLRE